MKTTLVVIQNIAIFAIVLMVPTDTLALKLSVPVLIFGLAAYAEGIMTGKGK